MAYSIRYGVQRQEILSRRHRDRFGLMVMGFLVLFLLGVQLFWEEGAQVIRQLVFPLQEQAVAALENMAQSIRDGATVPDAVTAFCREVIESAPIS